MILPRRSPWGAQLETCLLRSDLAASASKRSSPVKAALWVQKQNVQTAVNRKCQDFHFDTWVHSAPPYTFFWHFQRSRLHAAPRETANAEGGVTGQSPQLKQSSPWGEILQGLLIERTSCTAWAVTATSSEHVFLTVPLQSHSEVNMMNSKSISGNLEMVISSAVPSVSKHQYKIEQNHHGHQSSELSKFRKVRRNILTVFWL